MPFSSYLPTNGRALLGPQASSPALRRHLDYFGLRVQARTPAVPEEDVRWFEGVTKGYGLFRENAGVLACSQRY